ncbi:serine/threonine-protein kinase [Candidatus Uabimicrobium amorphum]|uniref:Protein kinase n=1 Tax=Uabimicrobium amorphum TaxID=2596890 RepID=A0A5S9F169_UABAM|nr:serine/threonine-protein kinase [Candidatus Uabimicrobium amorphum]BBM82297.1 protein kinase [Candidatus Uabimicrobium amorphum]
MNNTIEQEIEKLEKNYIRILQQQKFVEPQVLENVLQEYKNLKSQNPKLELPDFLLEKNVINKMQHRAIVKKLRDYVKNDQSSNFTPVKKKSYKSYGPYKIMERVASGAMGVIYKAEDTRDGGIVALKIIRDGGDAKKIRKERFDREARSALMVKSPGVVTIRDSGEINNIPFIAMDFVEGSTLDEYWEELENKDINEAVRIGIIIARALAHIHKAGIIHRDVKPANVLMDCTIDPPFPMITDFSLAMITDPLEKKLTQTGVAVGTPYYMSPEQTFGIREDIGPHTDTYSLGAVLYEMLCNNPPFKAKSIRELYHKIQKQQPTSLMKRNPKIPPILEQIIFKALEKKTTTRYKSCDDFADVMEKYLKGEDVVLEKPGFSTQVNKFINSHYRVIRKGTLAAMVFAIITMSAILIFGKKNNGGTHVFVNKKSQVQEKLFSEEVVKAKRFLSFPSLNEKESSDYLDQALSTVNNAFDIYNPPLRLENLVWQANEYWVNEDPVKFWSQVEKWQKLPVDDFLIAISKSNEKDHFSRALAFFHIGYLNKALQATEKYHFEDELAKSLRARLQWSIGLRHKQAKAKLASLKNKIFTNSKGNFPLILAANSHFAEAHNLALKLVEENPENALWKLILGVIYKEIGLFRLAEEKLGQIDSPVALKNAALFHKGLCLKKQALYQEAIDEFRSILQEQPHSPQAFYELLACGIELGDGQLSEGIKNSVQRYAAKNLSKISDHLTYEQASLVYQFLHNEHGEYFTGFQKIENESSNLYYLKGLMALNHAKRGQPHLFNKAFLNFISALEMEPSHYKAAYEAARIKKMQKKYEEAFNYYSHAFWCAPNWKKRKGIYEEWMILAFQEQQYWHLGQFLHILRNELVANKASNFKQNWIRLCKKAQHELNDTLDLNNILPDKWLYLQNRAISYFLSTASVGSVNSKTLSDFLVRDRQNTAEAMLLKAMLLYLAGNHDEALKHIDRVSPEALASKGRFLKDEVAFLKIRILQQKKDASVYEKYKNISAENPLYQQRTSYLISVNELANKIKQTDPNKAIEMLEDALRSSSNNALKQKAKGHLLLSEIYRNKDEHEKAIENCKYAISEAPSWYRPYLILGEIYEQQKNYTEALKYYSFAWPLVAENANDKEDFVSAKIKEIERKLDSVD